MLPLAPFGGSTPWDTYIVQFNSVTAHDGWDVQAKYSGVVSQLRGPAIELLTTLPDASSDAYGILMNALEIRFRNKHHQEIYHS